MRKKILVVNMNYMGDALLTTPAIAALRRAYPDAEIDTVVGEGAAADVLAGNPDVNNILTRTARGSWERCMQLYKLLREGQYTDAIILPALPAYAISAFLARTPNRIGLAGRGMNQFLTLSKPTASVHMADALLDTIDVPASARSSERSLYVHVNDEDLAVVKKMLTDAGIDIDKPVVAVNIGATRPQKRWQSESFAELIDLLSGTQIVIVGAGDDDQQMAEVIISQIKQASPVNLVGRTSVKNLAALLKKTDLLISADSGPMHLASAVGTPVVALFGSTDPAVSGPYDEISKSIYKSLPCAPCGNHPTCGGRYDCMRRIKPDEVAKSARQILNSHVKELTAANRREAALSRPQAAAVIPQAKTQYKKILIATKFRFIGDTLLAIPIFRAVRALCPHAKIILLTGKNARMLLQNNPYLDGIIEFDPYRVDKGQKAFWNLVKQIRSGQFDLCLALNRSFHSALIPWLGGVKTRAGFTSEGRTCLLNRRIDYDKEKSEISCYFDVLRSVAPDAPDDPKLELWVSPAESVKAREAIESAIGKSINDVTLIGIQPGASLDNKRWKCEGFAKVAESLLTPLNPPLEMGENSNSPSPYQGEGRDEVHSPSPFQGEGRDGVQSPSPFQGEGRDEVHFCREGIILLVGGPDEVSASEKMIECCAPEYRNRIFSFVGKCNLRESLAIVSHLQLFVGNDTAVMHSAVALDVPTVALFGPTNARKWGNYGKNRRVLESGDGTMNISEDLVASAARDLLYKQAKVCDPG